MLIRNQNKEQLVNMDHIISFMANDDGTVTIVVRGNDYIIGEYSSEDKALKVLDMIQEWRAMVELLKLSRDEKAANVVEIIQESNHGLVNTFQMPQDSEV